MRVHKTSSEFNYYEEPSSKSVWSCASLTVWVEDDCALKEPKCLLIIKRKMNEADSLIRKTELSILDLYLMP